MAGPRRVTAPPAQPEGINFGSLGFYAGGFTLPEGDYALEFMVQMHQVMKQTGQPAGPARLGVMLTAYPLGGGEPLNQFLSMGSKADQSFAPDPDTGKSLVPIPGGPASTLNNQTNWALFLKSMYDSGLPDGIFTNDLSVLDGVHVHTQLVPEPEDRKGFGAQTGEVQAQQRPGLIPVVTEIKEDGKPWEGKGGIPKQATGTEPKAAPVAQRATTAAAPQATTGNGEDVLASAINGVTAVIEKNPAGVTKLLLRTGTFKAVNEAAGADMAQAVIDQYFGSDASLNSVLNQLGYGLVGTQVKPTS